MAEQEGDYQDSVFSEFTLKIRDLEEKQRIMKERMLLIGKNLVELKEDTAKKNLEIKKELETIKQIMERTKSFLESASEEFSKFARKEDIEILQKQAKMFQPLDFVRKKDLKEMINLKQ